MKLELTSCNENHWEFVRLLRNDPRVKSGFISEANITPEMQRKYMQNHSDNYRIALLDGTPVGYVGVIDDDIRVCTHPDYQGKGIGKFMINELKSIWPNAKAKVKFTNESSFKLFKSCGFEIEYYILRYKAENK